MGVIHTIKGELNFGLDNFGKQVILSEEDTIAQLILNILFMKPGQMPSMPHIGINIRQYLYNFQDDLDVEDLKSKISFQCSSLIPFIDMSGLQLFVVDYRGESILMIIIPLSITNSQKNLMMGLKKTNDNGVLFNYQFEDKLE